MNVEPDTLERWIGAHETDAEVMLARSGIRRLASDRFDIGRDVFGSVKRQHGNRALRAAIADRYDRDPGTVLPTCGGREASFLAFLALLGEHAVVLTPTDRALTAVPAAVGAVSEVPLSPPEWELDVDRVAEAVRPETAVVGLANPNDPTGRYYSRETIEALYDVAADAGAYLLCEEGARQLVERPHPPTASLGPYGVSTSDLSVAYGLPGLRVGWLAGPPEVLDAASAWQDYTTGSPSLLDRHVALQALDRAAEILPENRRLARSNRERLADFLDELGLEWYEPVGASGFVTVPEGFATGRSFCERVFDETSVLLAPGDAFGVPDRFRIGFGLEPEALAEGLSRLDSFFSRHY